MKEKTCCFTGHRTLVPSAMEGLKLRLKERITFLLKGKGVSYFGIGGAMGFDMLAADTLLEMKWEYPEIRLILVLPCGNHDARWPMQQKEHMKQVMAQADKQVVLMEQYRRGCMHQRNRYMVSHSQYLIAHCNRTTGGSAYTLAYAKSKGLTTYLV